MERAGWRRGAIGAVALAATMAVGGEARAKAADPCRSITEAGFRSCKTGTQSGRWLGVARCANLASASARKACNQQVATDAKDAADTCKAQRAARQATCGRLGGSAYGPTIDPASFVASIDNPLFPLTPGQTFVYEGQTAGGLEHSEFAVTHNTKTILGVTCVEVHDTVTLNGELTEDTLDWFAQDKSGNVWYFGENSKQLAGGLIVGVEGSWTGGVDGAEPGIVMEAHPAVGDFYRQEFLLGDAEDLAEVVSLAEAATVPAGSYTNCLKTKETAPLEPDAMENKLYAAGVGNVLTVDLVTGERSELVRIVTQ